MANDESISGSPIAQGKWVHIKPGEGSVHGFRCKTEEDPH